MLWKKGNRYGVPRFRLTQKGTNNMSKKFTLLLIPLIIPCGGMFFMMVYAMVVAGAPFEILFLLCIAAASLVNVLPFLILYRIHSRRVRLKLSPCNYSFYISFIAGTLVMLVVIADLLKTFVFGRQGGAFIGIVFILLPILAIPVMVTGYFVGLVLEWVLRKRKSIGVHTGD
jgi:hypothetical protein